MTNSHKGKKHALLILLLKFFVCGLLSGSSKYAVSGDKQQTTIVDVFLLVLYVITMAGVLVAQLLAVFLY